MESLAVLKKLGMSFSIIGLLLAVSGEATRAINPEKAKAAEVEREIRVVLLRYYLDGEISKETIYENVSSMKDFWVRYHTWQLVKLEQDQIVFRRSIDDISPLLKANGYFGLSNNDVLTIYDGPPGKSKVIQSFYQIDVGKLESSTLELLREGIPVKTKASFVKVLETLKPIEDQVGERPGS
ncbi:BofC C-terminal domain-containing protein [Bacillus massilinigeriensis]|uniref:BofC C-terminal domain-containing protein n=1 Tax=Bacillus mediterraneensis TaxID=1805474 RepID=UPI001F44659E|nr:BofC C-terminal domain-containing protein [Bacillus mediterraneensis]